MSRYRLYSLCILVWMSLTISAQEQYAIKNNAKADKKQQYFSLTAGIGLQEYTQAFDWMNTHLVGKKKNWSWAYGVRATTYFGKEQDYKTAPPRITSGKVGPAVFFTEDIPENLDTVFFPKVQVNFINAFVAFQYRIQKKWMLEFNIDVVGLSFGGRRTGDFISSDNTGQFLSRQSASPTVLNALLISDNDWGSLNSEILTLKYQLNERWAIKAAWGFLFTEYTTENELTFDNDRFRNKSVTLNIGIVYKKGIKKLISEG